jgi:protein TonB
MAVAGYFRAHSRKGLSLDADDVAFLDARFRSPHHIALLVRPFATKTSVGGLFIREDGVFHGEASYLEFPFRSAQLTASLWAPPEAAAPAAPPAAPANAAPSAPPAAKPGVRPQVVPIGLRRDAAPAADAKPAAPAPEKTDRKAPETKPPAAPAKPPAAEAKAAAPARPAAPEPKPAAKEVKPAAAVTVTKDVAPAKPAEPAPVVKPAPERPLLGTLSGAAPAESQGSGKLMMVIGGIAVMVAILVALFVWPGYMTRSHPPAAVESQAGGLNLLVEPSGTDLLLTWNKNSAVIANASHGVLSINDGDQHENFDMDAKDLTTGSIVYTPKTGDVSFILEVTGKNQSKTATESVRSLRTRPSPMPDGKSAANTTAAKASPAQPAPAGATANAEPVSTTPAEVTPATQAKATPKAFNADSLKDRLRPASPTEIADAGLGAAPASPAGVNVNANLSVPFANAPAPVAPAPAPAVKKPSTSGGKVASAQLLYHKDPEYPTAARQMNAHGQVVLDATIGTDGKVIAVKVISGHPLLVQAAKAAVMQWRYRPTLLDGQPVENTTQITLTFGATH